MDDHLTDRTASRLDGIQLPDGIDDSRRPAIPLASLLMLSACYAALLIFLISQSDFLTLIPTQSFRLSMGVVIVWMSWTILRSRRAAPDAGECRDAGLFGTEPSRKLRIGGNRDWFNVLGWRVAIASAAFLTVLSIGFVAAILMARLGEALFVGPGFMGLSRVSALLLLAYMLGLLAFVSLFRLFITPASRMQC